MNNYAVAFVGMIPAPYRRAGKQVLRLGYALEEERYDWQRIKRQPDSMSLFVSTMARKQAPLDSLRLPGTSWPHR
jgi:hypothetical protein